MIKYFLFVSLVWCFVIGGWIRGFGNRLEGENLFQTPWGDSDLVWVSVDVSETQQGDAHLILAREGPVALIDGGGAAEGTQSLLPFLRKFRINRIDHLLITHPHTDHYGGAISLLEAGFPIGQIFWAEPTNDLCKTEPWGCFPDEIEKLKMLAVHSGVPLRKMADFNEIRIGLEGRLKKIFHVSSENCPVKKCSINDFSLINELTVGPTRALFTGDLDHAVGGWLAREKPELLKADVLKVPHHGTAGLPSNEFFQVVDPSAAIVPGSHALWCEDRSREPREWFLARQGSKTKTFVSGVNGHIRINFFRNGRIWVGTNHFEKRPLSCRRRHILDRTALYR